MTNKLWKWGEKTRLARASGISLSYLCDILSARTGATPTLARTLRDEAQKLGKIIHELDWIYPAESKNQYISAHKKLKK